MKIDPFIFTDPYFCSKFRVQSGAVAGETVYLVNPRPSFFDWEESLLHFRSSIWSASGELISAGFKKFFNFEEKPTIDPFPKEPTEVKLLEKIDGSCFIVSKYNGQLILRTRGSFGIDSMENADEIPFLMTKYSKFFSMLESGDVTYDCSFLFEWTSPRNQIIIKHKIFDLTLIGIIFHGDYSLMRQESLDLFAECHDLRRPDYYNFSTDLWNLKSQDLNEKVTKELEGKEGVCVYYDGDQHIRKLKSLTYLKLHGFKSQLSYGKLVELYYDVLGCPETKEQMLAEIEQRFDFECRKMAEPLVTQIITMVDLVKSNINMLQNVVERSKHLDQKNFALAVFELVGKSKYSNYAFSLRKGTFKFADTKKYILENEPTA